MFFKAIPPVRAPILLKANPTPKNFPLKDLFVVFSKKSAQIGTIMPIARE